MDNRMDWHTKDHPGLLSDFGDFMDGVDELIFVPLTTVAPVKGVTDPADQGDDTDPAP